MVFMNHDGYGDNEHGDGEELMMIDKDIMVYLYERKKIQQIHDEACVIYQFIYKYEKLNKYRNKCDFSCEIVGETLCEIHSRNQ